MRWGRGVAGWRAEVPPAPRERPPGAGPVEGVAAGAGLGQPRPDARPASHLGSQEPSPYDESDVHDSFHQLIQEQSRWVAEEGLELQERELGAGAPQTTGEPTPPGRCTGPAGGALSLPSLSQPRAWAGETAGRRVSRTSRPVFVVCRQRPPDPTGAGGCRGSQHSHAPHLGQHAQPHHW